MDQGRQKILMLVVSHMRMTRSSEAVAMRAEPGWEQMRVIGLPTCAQLDTLQGVRECVKSPHYCPYTVKIQNMYWAGRSAA